MSETILISEVIVKDRQRRDLEEVEDLAESIKRVGLIHPIVVDESNILLAGERRLTACKQLGWDEVPIRRFKELSDIERKEVELEENIRRKALCWQDEVRAKMELDKLKRELYGSAYPGQLTSGWRIKDTAVALGESIGSTSMDIQVAKAMDNFPQLAAATTKTQAYKRYKQLIDRAVREALVEESTNTNHSVDFDLILGNCLEKMKDLSSESVDLIVTDPPYGVSVDTSKVGREYIGTFDDSRANWVELLASALTEMYRLLKPGGHMYLFFGPRNHSRTMELLDYSEFEYDSIPCIWYKGSGAGFPYNPLKRFRYNYEPFRFCWKGESRHLNEDRGCMFEVPLVAGTSKMHPTEKPYELGKQLVELSSIEGEVVLDPFAGVGGLILPAYHLGRKTIAIEQDTHYFSILSERFNNEDDNIES